MPLARLSILFTIGLFLAGLTYSSPVALNTKNNVTYYGIVKNGIEKFLNIPYGQDTSGEKRFSNPEPFTFPPNATTYNATAKGPVCPQPVTTSGPVTAAADLSEDCLRLKVARPAGVEAGDKLPVMVYIHGGGLFSGHINDVRNEPDGLILRSIENGLPIVYVAMNYRLSIFGFALSEPLKTNKSLNVGLKDQRLALEWVQQNIAFFGGDPEHVTVFGQSSGALSVTLQILSYGGTRPIPFHAGIMQSTALEAASTSNLTHDTYNAVAELAACDVDDDPQSPASLECLRSLPFEELLNVTIVQHDSTADSNTGDVYLPAVDDDFLPGASSELTLEGVFPKIPLMIGWTDQDATEFTHTNISTPSDTRNFIQLFFPGLTNDTLTALLSLYSSSDFTADPAANLTAEFYRSAQIHRDIIFTCPSFLFGHAMAQKFWNDSSEEAPSVYYYDQNQIVASTGVVPPGLGVIHGSELRYIFGFSGYNATGGIHPTSDDLELQKRESRTWSSFASLGRPSLDGRKTLEGWRPAYGEAGDGQFDVNLYVVGGPDAGISRLSGEGATPHVLSQRLRERCEFLNREYVIAELKY
ncbi:hypothetical protein V5O48_015075 [Marasmius crinis-equi]|uniref:Carboxylic ester hydrolase n=1 Tax=Marasmius crinis-equi TaxID=585013 RepID=A0ABR3EVT9_9AGAR